MINFYSLPLQKESDNNQSRFYRHHIPQDIILHVLNNYLMQFPSQHLWDLRLRQIKEIKNPEDRLTKLSQGIAFTVQEFMDECKAVQIYMREQIFLSGTNYSVNYFRNDHSSVGGSHSGSYKPKNLKTNFDEVYKLFTDIIHSYFNFIESSLFLSLQRKQFRVFDKSSRDNFADFEMPNISEAVKKMSALMKDLEAIKKKFTDSNHSISNEYFAKLEIFSRLSTLFEGAQFEIFIRNSLEKISSQFFYVPIPEKDRD